MQSAIQYFLFSGLAWFAAGAIILIASMIPRSRFDPLVRVVILLAAGVGLLAGTPIPLLLALPLSASITALAVLFGKEPPWLRIVSALLVVAALVHEARYFLVSPRQGTRPKHVVVIGDSLSSGGFGEGRIWPQMLGVPVENLSQPSETVSSALQYQLPRLGPNPPNGEVVLIEVGGNDLLGGTKAAQFERDLDRLMRGARADGRRRVVMFELPVLPGTWSFGIAQRRLAQRYDVELIPKRVLVRILTNPDNVADDALHLTEEGHSRFAAEVRRWLRLDPAASRE